MTLLVLAGACATGCAGAGARAAADHAAGTGDLRCDEGDAACIASDRAAFVAELGARKDAYDALTAETDNDLSIVDEGEDTLETSAFRPALVVRPGHVRARGELPAQSIEALARALEDLGGSVNDARESLRTAQRTVDAAPKPRVFGAYVSPELRAARQGLAVATARFDEINQRAVRLTADRIADIGTITEDSYQRFVAAAQKADVLDPASDTWFDRQTFATLAREITEGPDYLTNVPHGYPALVRWARTQEGLVDLARRYYKTISALPMDDTPIGRALYDAVFRGPTAARK